MIPDKFKKFSKPAAIAFSIGLLALASQCQNKEPQVADELVQITAKLAENDQRIVEQLEDVKAIASTGGDFAAQQEAQRIVDQTSNTISAFDDATYELLSDLVRERAGHIYRLAQAESAASGDRVELILSRELGKLSDRSYALATQHNGRVRMDNQDMFDTAAGQLIDQMAIAHLLERQTYAQPPEEAIADFGAMFAKIEGLSKVLFELNAQRSSLHDLAVEAQEEVDVDGQTELAKDE